MNATHETIKSIIAQQHSIDTTLRAIFTEHFELDSEKMEQNPGHKAYAGYAVEVAVSLANLILAVRRPESGRSFRAISDLTYALNANEFWLKNAPVLVPVLTTVLNAHKDHMDMIMRRAELSEYAGYDKLMSAASGAPLELFAMMLYLVGGPLLMASSSLALKEDLAPYFLN